MQVTGRANFTAFYQWLKETKKNDDPNILSLGSPYVARTYPFLISGFWWYKNNMNDLADNGSVEQVTRRVNGGINGLADRQAYFNRCVKVIN